jgi:DNA replication protein DnaC
MEQKRRLARASELSSAWAATGVPKRYRDVQPDREGLDGMGTGLYLTGPKGTGKTTAACAILKAYVMRNTRDGWCSARFVSAPDWLASMRGRWGREEDEAYGRAANCKMLVLDDLGKGNPSGWASERLFRLIDHRYNEELPTIFTSQYDLGEIDGKLTANDDYETTDAVVSRIAETCRGVKFDGPDLRVKKFKDSRAAHA